MTMEGISWLRCYSTPVQPRGCTGWRTPDRPLYCSISTPDLAWRWRGEWILNMQHGWYGNARTWCSQAVLSGEEEIGDSFKLDPDRSWVVWVRSPRPHQVNDGGKLPWQNDRYFRVLVTSFLSEHVVTGLFIDEKGLHCCQTAPDFGFGGTREEESRAVRSKQGRGSNRWLRTGTSMDFLTFIEVPPLYRKVYTGAIHTMRWTGFKQWREKRMFVHQIQITWSTRKCSIRTELKLDNYFGGA